MTFRQRLDAYLKTYTCSPAALVAFSGVSAATISRYRAGTRTPSPDSVQFARIVSGLSKAAAASGRIVPEASIRRELLSSLIEEDPFDHAVFRINLNTLVDKMHLNSKQAADTIGLDYSAFFRIRSGQRRPSDPEGFCRRIAQYALSCAHDELSRDILCDVLGCTSAELEREPDAEGKIADWLLHGAETQRQHVRDFLFELDRFDLEQYIAGFGRAASPNVSVSDGACSARREEEAFIRALPEPAPGEVAFVCTDIFSDLTAQTAGSLLEPEYITAMLIRKGYRVRLVLNTDHPIDALLCRLESLMPVFMSGRVEAYCLKGRQDNVYRSRLISLRRAAICTEAICGHEASARACVFRDQADAAYYRARVKQIFACAVPLIEIIDRDEQRRAAVIREDRQRSGKRFSFLSTPPIYTICDTLLDKILLRNGIDGDDAQRIRQYIASERARILRILRHTEIVDRIPDVSPAAYADKPIFLSLSGLFYDREILYTYDEYVEHMSLTRAFERQHKNYRAVADENAMFRNVQIFINAGYWIMLSKNRTPAIHLFIRHPKLRQSFENMLLLYGNR